MDQSSKHSNQALALIEANNILLIEIERIYAQDLSKAKISDALLIKIKNLLENLRSALEYCAQDLAMKYGQSVNTRKVSFPYARLDVSREKFVSKKFIENKIPGLSDNCPRAVELILAMQHFSDPRCKWFPAFMDLTNTNKHIELTPHEKFEGVQAQIGGATIIAKGIDFKGRPIESTGWSEFIITGVDWPMTAIEFIRHCQRALSGVVRQFIQIAP